MIALAVKRSIARDLVALAKPRITVMVTATGIAAALAAKTPMSSARAFSALFGTLLVVGGANALNQWLERDTDARMERTRDRPLAAGRMSSGLGLAFGIALSALSMPLLAFAGPVVALLGAIALVTYVAFYTPMKRRTAWSLPVGAIAGAMPPAMGWATATGELSSRGCFFFLVLFVWQLPHFLAIAIARGDDYARGGLAVGATGTALFRAKWLLLASSIAFAAVTIVGARSRLWIPATLGAALVALSIRVLRSKRSCEAARDVFAWTMGHLAIVLVALSV
jgi:protoheme IX farnesyltransferase